MPKTETAKIVSLDACFLKKGANLEGLADVVIDFLNQIQQVPPYGAINGTEIVIKSKYANFRSILPREYSITKEVYVDTNVPIKFTGKCSVSFDFQNSKIITNITSKEEQKKLFEALSPYLKVKPVKYEGEIGD